MKNQLETFSKLTNNKQKNMMFSPVSFNTVLAILSEVAVGDTKEKIKEYLEREYSALFKEFFNIYKNDDNNVFAFSNGLWINEKYTPGDKVKFVQDLYNMNIFKTDFKDAEHLASDINSYVDEKTFHMIPKIVESKDVKGSDSVFVNAVYFQSAWKNSLFRRKDLFLDFEGNKKETDFVYGKADAYMENDSAIAFSKNYENNIQFIGILPKKENFEVQDLNIEELLNSKSYKYDVSIGMPVLNFETEMELSSLLPALGLEDLLTGRNMTELYEDKTAFRISRLIQNTKIELDENGTKASAATAAVVLRNCAFMLKERKEVILNKPFFFFIYDEHHEEILFIGKVVSV